MQFLARQDRDVFAGGLNLLVGDDPFRSTAMLLVRALNPLAHIGNDLEYVPKKV
jgi:hypothetical protein